MKIYLYLGAAAAFIVLGLYSWGLRSERNLAQSERDTAIASALGLSEQLKSERKEVARVNTLLESLENKEVEIIYVDKVITKETVKYRDRVPVRCQLSPSWVCIANSAAKGLSADCSTVEI